MARLSKQLRTEVTERQYHEADPHLYCEDDPCDACHRFAGGLFCAECGEQLRGAPVNEDFCSAQCSVDYLAANPVVDAHENCDDEPCAECVEARADSHDRAFDELREGL